MDQDDEDACSVCLEVFRDAVMLDGCGHTYCAECAQALRNQQCPECRVPFTKLLPNWAIRKKLAAAASKPAATPSPDMTPKSEPIVTANNDGSDSDGDSQPKARQQSFSSASLRGSKVRPKSASSASSSSGSPASRSWNPVTSISQMVRSLGGLGAAATNNNNTSYSNTNSSLANVVSASANVVSSQAYQVSQEAMNVVGQANKMAKNAARLSSSALSSRGAQNPLSLSAAAIAAAANIANSAATTPPPPSALSTATAAASTLSPSATAAAAAAISNYLTVFGKPLILERSVFFFDRAGRLCELYWRNRWVFYDHSAKFGATLGIPGETPAACRMGQIFYRNAEGRLVESYWANYKWVHVDHSATSGAPSPAGKISVATDAQLFYRSERGELTEMYWTKRAGWCFYNHGDVGGDPVAVFGRVFYRDLNRHFCMRVWNDGSAAWNTFDLTASSGAPCVHGNLAILVLMRRNLVNIYYRSDQGRVIEVSVSLHPKSNKVEIVDHTDKYGAPRAACDPIITFGTMLYSSPDEAEGFYLGEFRVAKGGWEKLDPRPLSRELQGFASAERRLEPKWQYMTALLSTASLHRTQARFHIWLRRLDTEIIGEVMSKTLGVLGHAIDLKTFRTLWHR